MTRSKRARLPGPSLRPSVRTTARRRSRDPHLTRYRAAPVSTALALLGLGAVLLGTAPAPGPSVPVPVGYVIDLAVAPIPTPPSPPPMPTIPSPPSAPSAPGPSASVPAEPVPGSSVPRPLAPGVPGSVPSGAALPSDADPTDPGDPVDSADPAGTDPGTVDQAADQADAGADATSTDAARPRARTARQLRIFLTGYSFHDNTPPLSAIISAPILHRAAGGTGTYRDPITVAVPGSGTAMKWKPGTRFYLPSVRRYVIVEDSGASPAPRGVDTHLDMWIGGQGGTRSATDACMSKLTGTVTAVLNPRPGLPVMAGPVFSNHTCRLPLLSRAGGALGKAGGGLGKAVRPLGR